MGLIKNLRKRHRYPLVLLKELVITDFKLKYQNSVLGYAWSVLRPLFLFAILYLVFGVFLKAGAGIPNYPVYLLLGIVLWSFFADMTNQSLPAIVGRGDLIRKIRIPRWLIVVAASLSALINLGFSLIVVVIFSLINHVPFTLQTLWFPLFVLELYFFSLAFSLILSALYVKYRDLIYIWEVAMQAGFYLVPILWPISLLHSKRWLQKIIMLNPIAQAIQGARHVVVTKQALTITDIFKHQIIGLVPIFLVVVIFGLSVVFFRKQSRHFAEDL